MHGFRSGRATLLPGGHPAAQDRDCRDAFWATRMAARVVPSRAGFCRGDILLPRAPPDRDRVSSSSCFRFHRRYGSFGCARVPGAVRGNPDGRAYLVDGAHEEPGRARHRRGACQSRGRCCSRWSTRPCASPSRTGAGSSKVPAIPVLDPVIGALAKRPEPREPRPPGAAASPRQRWLFRPHRRDDLRHDP